MSRKAIHNRKLSETIILRLKISFLFKIISFEKKSSQKFWTYWKFFEKFSIKFLNFYSGIWLLKLNFTIWRSSGSPRGYIIPGDKLILPSWTVQKFVLKNSKQEVFLIFIFVSMCLRNLFHVFSANTDQHKKEILNYIFENIITEIYLPKKMLNLMLVFGQNPNKEKFRIHKFYEIYSWKIIWNIKRCEISNSDTSSIIYASREVGPAP